MPQYRSGTNYSSANRVVGDVTDNGTNTIISTGVGFGDAPLAEHVVAQIKYGVANGQFNLFPPDAALPLGETNKLPFWDVIDLCDTPGAIEAVLTTADGGATYGVTIDPTGAILDDQIVIRARVPVLTDTNLAVRQKLVSSLTKSAVYSGANQWDLVASAEYFSHSNESLSYLAIGTASHNQTWTQIGGTTTPGGSAISSSAAYCDITYTLTATTTVTDTTTLTINSCLLATSEPTVGAFLVTESFVSSATWAKPTGIDYLVGVVAVGAGGGGGGGGFYFGTQYRSALGGAGGGGAGMAYIQNLYIGDQSSISIGIGAAGAGGTSSSRLGGTVASVANSGGNGGAGGATTFGSYITCGGGGGGAGGIIGVGQSNDPVGTAVGGTVGTGSNTILGGFSFNGAIGASTGTASTNGANSSLSSYSYVPLTAAPSVGASGGTSQGTASAKSLGSPTSGGAASYEGGGGGGGGVRVNASSFATYAVKSAGNGGAGGGGGHCGLRSADPGTSFAGSGGAAAAFSGAGGGGGGALVASVTGAGTGIFCIGGAGGSGASGYVVIAYVA